MKLVIAIGFLLASILGAQAQGGAKHRKPAQPQATAAGNASHAQDRSRQLSYQDVNDPWAGPRTCY